jgi:hypothetical protein
MRSRDGSHRPGAAVGERRVPQPEYVTLGAFAPTARGHDEF